MTTNNSTAIVFFYRSSYFKLVDIEWGPDNSFYFTPCQHEHEVGKALQHDMSESGVVKISPNEFSTGFPMRRISRHRSGYFHIKDVAGPGGTREKDGLRGPAFSNINGIYVFLVVIPQLIDTMVEIKNSEPTDIVVNLPDSIEPFSIQFAVRDRSKSVKLNFEPGELLGNGLTEIAISSLDFSLIMMMLNARLTSSEISAPFPVKTCYIVR